MRVVALTEQDRDRFNAAVSASPLADVLQSWEWGELKQATGWSALRLLVEDDDGTPRAACSILRQRPARGVPAILYAPRGPIFSDDDPDALRALLGEVKRRAGSAFIFKCDPAVERGSNTQSVLRDAGLIPVASGGFGGVQPTAVMVLELDRDLDAVLEGFKSKWRYNIRLAERKGVTVRDGSRADLPVFHRIYIETAARDGFVGRSRTYFERMWDLLEPRGMLKMFVAEFDGEPIAAIICTAMGKRVVYNYGASSNEHRNVMPNHLIQWTAIRWAHAAGYALYDFRGVSPVRDGEPVEQHLAGLNRFKEGFGARYIEYAGEFDLPLRRAWYLLWKAAGPAAIRARARIRGRGEPAGE